MKNVVKEASHAPQKIEVYHACMHWLKRSRLARIIICISPFRPPTQHVPLTLAIEPPWTRLYWILQENDSIALIKAAASWSWALLSSKVPSRRGRISWSYFTNLKGDKDALDDKLVEKYYRDRRLPNPGQEL